MVNLFKGRSSKALREEFPELKEFLWGKSFCADGHFAETSGQILVHEECQKAGIQNAHELYVKYSAKADIYAMVSQPHGIIVGKTIYDSYMQDITKADLSAIRFIIRHEAGHILHHNHYKRSCCMI